MPNNDFSTKVSVVIVTRNRYKDLAHCLVSLSNQYLIVDELVIVDNNSTDLTQRLIGKFLGLTKINIKNVICKKVGYPHVYQFGLDAATHDWVAFIDDDCVAGHDWYKQIKLTILKHQNCSVILGSTAEFNDKNSVSLAKAYIDEVGKIGAIENKSVTDFEILDSKNIIYNRSFLKKSGLAFDTDLLKYGNGASEDCDMGMQIFKAGGIAIYGEKIKAWHKDPTSIFNYYKKLFFTLKNHLIYEQKWSHIRRKILTKRTLDQKLDLFWNFCERYELGILRALLVFSHISLTFILIKIGRLFYQRDIFRLNIPKI